MNSDVDFTALLRYTENGLICIIESGVMTVSEWNAELYLQFESERTQPANDLISRINIESPKKIIDIGCGSGNSTAALSRRFNNAAIIGVDNSKNMIEKASRAYPRLGFSLCDASKDLSCLGNDFDLVFSNACLQWIPKHTLLIGELFGLLGPKGVLAVQIPINHDEPLYRIIEEAAGDSRWGFGDAELETGETLSPLEYYDILSGLTCEFSIWETTYFHRMPSHQSLVDWVKGTKLRPYLNALSAGQGLDFENEIRQKVTNTYKMQKNGEIIFKFRRLFFIAQQTK